MRYIQVESKAKEKTVGSTHQLLGTELSRAHGRGVVAEAHARAHAAAARHGAVRPVAPRAHAAVNWGAGH